VDARYSKGPHYTKGMGTLVEVVERVCVCVCVVILPAGLSRWVRQRIQHEYDFNSYIYSLKKFVGRMMSSETPDAEGSTCESSTSKYN